MDILLAKIRPKETTKAIETVKDLLDDNPTADIIFDFKTHAHAAEIGQSVIQDLSLEEGGVTWNAINKTHLDGGAILLRQIIETPITDPTLIAARQTAITELTTRPAITTQLAHLKELEADVLWTQNTPDIKKTWPIPLIFPTWPVLSYINYSRHALGAYHIYRCVIAPLMSAATPISSALGPYFYLKYKLKLNIALVFYIKMLIALVLQANYSTFAYLIVIGYIALYAYGIFCNIESALMIYNLRNSLYKKALAIKDFITTSRNLIATIGPQLVSKISGAFLGDANTKIFTGDIVGSMTDIYQYWTNPTKREEMRTLIKVIYAIDVCFNATTLVNNYLWTITTIGPTCIIYDMKHPALKSQVGNPASLKKSLIVTGPNAAGKSTYVKALLCNVLLSQTLGIAYAARMETPIWESIHSYMRIWDTPGEESLFEAEMARCRQVLERAAAAEAAGRRAIFFLDEPMHSTPPIEGAATAKAMVKHLASMDGIRVVVTTHFHTIIDLPLNLARNVSMEAIPLASEKGFKFPYKIRKGGSRQCIALELLKEHDLPEAVIADAIKFKNIICENK